MAEFKPNWCVFNCDCTDTCRISTLNVGGQSAIRLHNLRINPVVIRSELKYVIRARNVDFWGAGVVWKPVASVRFPVGTAPGSDEGIWTRS